MSTNRNLDSMEQGMELFNRYAHSLNVVVVSKIGGFIDSSIMRQSLDLVQKLHPSLNTHIIGDVDNLRFITEGTSRIPLKVVNGESDYWKILVERELNQKIESEKVLARVILLQTTDTERSVNYLITTLHHAITDALSGINLHSTILAYYQETLNGHIPEVIDVEALPPLETLAKEFLKTTEGEKLVLPNKDSIVKLEGNKQISHLERTCKISHRRMDLYSSDRLFKKCKEMSVTVHGAICAAMMFALAKKIHAQNQDLQFSCRSSVDMRRRLEPQVSGEYLSMLVSALTSFHGFTEKMTFWELAKSVTEQIKIRLQTSEVYKGVVHYKTGAEYLLAHPEVTPFSIFVTNIGKINIPTIYGSLTLEEISYALSIKVMGNVFGVAVSTFAEQIVFNFIFAYPLIEQETVDSLIIDTIEQLTTLE